MRREGREEEEPDPPVDTGALEVVEHREEQVGGHGGAEQVGDVDQDKLCAVTVVLRGDAQQSYGRHEARHQGESHRQHGGRLICQEVFLLGLLFPPTESDQQQYIDY